MEEGYADTKKDSANTEEGRRYAKGGAYTPDGPENKELDGRNPG